MKQIIVLMAMILLGLAISGFVGEFGKSATDLSTTTVSQIEKSKVASGTI